MYVVCVRIQVVEGGAEAFIDASRANHEGTRQEPGNRRFDVLRHATEANRFFLYEAYIDEAAFTTHQQTPHYLHWKEAVAPLMAEPRIGDRHVSVFPDPWV